MEGYLLEKVSRSLLDRIDLSDEEFQMFFVSLAPKSKASSHTYIQYTPDNRDSNITSVTK